jgi:hypothetical protein
MKRLLAFLLCMPLFATITKSPAACGSHPCTITLTCALATCDSTENAELQTTLDDTTIQRGDTVVMQAGRTWTGNFDFYRTVAGSSGYITFTSSLSSLCPATGTRVTPSHSPNMPKITNGGGSNGSATWRFLSGSTAPSYVKLDCMEIENYQDSSSGGGSDAVRIGSNTVVTVDELPHDIIIEHVLCHGVVGDDTKYTKNCFVANGKTVDILDSFAYEVKANIESHAIVAVYPGGTHNYLNNYLQSAAIVLLNGGDVQTVRENPNETLTHKFNYHWKPSRWSTDASLIMKNMVEFKTCSGSCTIEYNKFENNRRGRNDDQLGQALSTNARYNGPVFNSSYLTVNASTDTISAASALHITNGDILLFANGTVPAGLAGCVSATPCYAVGATSTTVQVSATMGGSPINITSTGSGSWDMLLLASWGGTNHVTYRNNIVDGSYGTWGMLMGDSNFSDLITVNNCEWNNNLFYNISTSYDITPPSGYYLTFGTLIDTAGSTCLVTHHTTVPGDTQNPPPDSTRMMLMDGALQAAAFTYKDNLEPGSAFPWKASGYGSGEGSVNARFSSGTFRNSTMTTMASTDWDGCTTVTCTALLYPSGAQWDANYMQWVNPSTHDYTLGPSSPYITASSTGGPIGVDMTALARISGVGVTPSTYTASLTFTMSAPINAATSTQPCILEVSSSSNLITQAGTYTVINALNPTMFTRQDSSAVSSVYSQVGSTGTWQIGVNDSALDVNGVLRNRALAPSTTYYYRVMCYGDTTTGSFTTTSAGTPATYFQGRVDISGQVVLQ